MRPALCVVYIQQYICQSAGRLTAALHDGVNQGTHDLGDRKRYGG